MPGTINIPTLVEPELIKIILCSMWGGVSQLGQYISVCVRENATVGWTTWLFPVSIRFKYLIYRKFLVSSISRRLDRTVYIWILPLYDWLLLVASLLFPSSDLHGFKHRETQNTKTWRVRSLVSNCKYVLKSARLLSLYPIIEGLIPGRIYAIDWLDHQGLARWPDLKETIGRGSFGTLGWEERSWISWIHQQEMSGCFSRRTKPPISSGICSMFFFHCHVWSPKRWYGG